MAQPVDKTRWATDGGADITDPSSGQRDIGWADGDDVDAGIFNSLLHNYYEWFQYLKNLTSEALTWVALQTFDAGVVMNKPSVGTALEINGEDGTSFRANHVIINGSNYTGVGTGSQHGVAFSVFGGTGGSATGQGAGQFTGGDSSTGSGGYGARSFGGDGVTGGDGLQAEGGNSTTNDGPAGLTGTGGTSTGTGVNGPGLKGIGQDSSVQPGLGVTARAGDLIDISGTLTHGGYIEQGDVFTDSGKGTRGEASVAKPALEILPGLQNQFPGNIHTNDGILISNKAGADEASYFSGRYGYRAARGLWFSFDQHLSGAGSGGFVKTQKYGVLSPYGVLAAKVSFTLTSSGSGYTLANPSNADYFNFQAPTHFSASLVRIEFDTTFIKSWTSLNNYTVVISDSSVDYHAKITARLTTGVFVGLVAAGAPGLVDIDAATVSSMRVDVMVFGM